MNSLSMIAFILNYGVNFPDIGTLDASLDILEISVLKASEINYPAVLDAWTQYLRKKSYVCSSCKETITPICPQCNHVLSFRQRILTDFLIDGFALENSAGILTLDRTYYKNYFHQLRILD